MANRDDGGAHERPLSRLLPSTLLPSGVLVTPPSARSARRLGSLTIAACDACRKFKTKCNGQRPICSHCLVTDRRCRWTTLPGETPSQALKRSNKRLQDLAAAQAELITLMKTLPETQARDLFHSIRTGVDLLDLITQVRTGDPSVELAVAPATRLRYEFPYNAKMPPEYIGDNPYLDSMLYEAAGLYAPGDYSRPLPVTSGHTDAYLTPFHAATVIDRLLIDAQPSRWTTVCSDNALMRQLLASFLRCEYSLVAAFQKDFFLEDMATMGHDFCSSLLVNTVLAYACVCSTSLADRAEYWNPRTLTYRFLAEAKRLWELEAGVPRITTIQSGILFSVIHNLCGLDKIGMRYNTQAVALCHQLGLFDSSIQGETERLRNGKIFTAWAVYAWEALAAFSFLCPPLLKEPPKDPLPPPNTHSSWYGEVFVQYPRSSETIATCFPQIFKARADFRTIMARYSDMAHRNKDRNRDRVGVLITEAYTFLASLKGWYAGLPHVLTARNIALPSHLQIHIYYHYLIIAIFEPHIQSDTSLRPSPTRIVADANRALHTLIRLYYLRHGYDAMDLFIVIPLVYSAFRCIDAINDRAVARSPEGLETLRSTLVLVTSGLYAQRRNHYLARVLYKVVRNRMPPAEARLLKDVVDLGAIEVRGEQALHQEIHSEWAVSPVGQLEHVETHNLTNLVKKLEIGDSSDGPRDRSTRVDSKV